VYSQPKRRIAAFLPRFQLRFGSREATLRRTMKRVIQATHAVILMCVAHLPAAFAASPVEIARSEQRPVVQVVNVSGTVTSPQSAILSPSIGGLVEETLVDAGDHVEKGSILVTLDSELARLALERAIAEETQARIALDDAKRRLTEAEDVGPKRGIAETEIKSLRAEVTRNQAALEAAAAAARQQGSVVRRHEVRAPFTGVVSRRLAQVGEWVNPGDGLVELVATEGLRFDFRVPQIYYARLDTATRVDLTLDAVPDEVVPGRVQAIVPVKDPGARTFLLRVVTDAQHRLPVTPGMSARAAIRVDTGREAVVVPRDALLLYPDGRKTVWVVEDDGDDLTVREQRVDAGLEFDGFVEIKSGLEAGLDIVTRGNEALRDGEVVVPR
jgi:RND family efflux transporter MFP subunit